MDFSIARCTRDGKASPRARRDAATRRISRLEILSSRASHGGENARCVASNAIALAPAPRRHRRGTFTGGFPGSLESIAFDAEVTVDHETTRRTHLARDLGAPRTSWYREIPRMVTDHITIVGALLASIPRMPTRAIAPLCEVSYLNRS